LEITLQKAGCFCGISLGKNPFGWRLAFLTAEAGWKSRTKHTLSLMHQPVEPNVQTDGDIMQSTFTSTR
jgi:hypothetical protein